MMQDSKVISKPSFVFFGTDQFSVIVLKELEKAGFLPAAVVTAPDREQGRGLKLLSPEAKKWAIARNIPVFQFEKLDEEAVRQLSKANCQLFIVASYGLIIPKRVLDIPPKGILNVHPSLLPKYRGASPIQSALLNGDEKTGVSIMLMDEKMDHGPILAKEKVKIIKEKETPKASELEKELAEQGGKLLAEVLPKWARGEITSIPQNESEATYTKKITKADGEIDLAADPYTNFLKIRAFDGWPGTFFFIEKHADRRGQTPEQARKIRVIIKSAEFKNEELNITRVLPEGGKEMGWEEFKRGYVR